MSVGPAKALLDTIGNAPLSRRYWLTTSLIMAQVILELYDFFIVGFLVSVVGPQWHLTFGQSSIILLAVGVGTIAGSLVMGRVADSLGRKFSIVFGGLLCALATGAIALLPDGNWVLFAALRFLVGFGLGGAGVSQITLMVEFTPTRHRTLLSSISLAPAALGVLVASLVAASFLDTLGWRGIAALGALPALISLLLWAVAPESVRWLISKGRFEEARATAAKMLDRPLASIPPVASTAAPMVAPPTPLGELFHEKRRFALVLLVYMGLNAASTGCFLWGPVIVAQLLDMKPAEAAGQFIYVSLIGIVGRIGFSFLPQRIGRRRAIQIGTCGAAAALIAAALCHDSYMGTVPLFLVFLVGGALFWDGAYTSILPYAAEVFPVRMAARGMGLGQAAGGLGKIIGPLALALIAGTDNYITPKATSEVVLPGFLFLGACALLSGVAITLLGVETHGRALQQEDLEIDPRSNA